MTSAQNSALVKKQASPEQLQTAKNLYLEGKPLKLICEKSGLKLKALQYHIGKSWKAEREAIRSELLDAMSEEKRIDLIEITSYGLTFLKNTLKELVEKSKREPSPGLLKTISTIVFEINKIKALDEGKPTEILSETKPATIVEMREMLKADPFLEIEEADTKEIEE